MHSEIKNVLRKSLILQQVKNLLTLSKGRFDFAYNDEDLNDEYYKAISAGSNKEMEHQIGRLTNYKKIIKEIKENKIKGDIIEFGSWRGFSLIWIAYLLERCAIFDKKIIGLDSFGGLPNSEGIFKKGAFSGTSHLICTNNVKYTKKLYEETKKNIFVEKFLFSEEAAIAKRIKEITPNKFCFIHIDCDISSSLEEIFIILTKNNLLEDTCYILFDDYDCMDSYKTTVDNVINKLKANYIVEDHSKTHLTKNFLLKKK